VQRHLFTRTPRCKYNKAVSNNKIATLKQLSKNEPQLFISRHLNMAFFLSHSMLLLATSILPLTNALPAPVPAILAGGPAIVPIPSNCTVTNLAPTTGQMRNESYIPTLDASNDILYSAYYPSPTTNATQMSLQCLQQCHGYGDGSQCKTAFWADKMPVPKGYYGSPGGQLENACLFFARTLTDEDFTAAPEGQASNAFAWGLEC